MIKSSEKRIVVAHNYYGDFAFGGETVVFKQEVELLRQNGWNVETFEKTNAEISRWRLREKMFAPFSFARSRKVYEEAKKLFQSFKPTILHVHNYKYVLTPAIFEAAKDCGVKTVLTLHNYRLIAPCGQLRRGDMICEECLRKNPSRILWRHGCATKFSSRVLQLAFFYQTRSQILKNVDVFIALTQFAKQKFLEAGLPKEKLFVKPNFVDDPYKQWDSREIREKIDGVSSDDCRLDADGNLSSFLAFQSANLDKADVASSRDFDIGLAASDNATSRKPSCAKDSAQSKNCEKKIGAIFIGRLSDEKGVRFLINAWRNIDYPLLVVGDGPERAWAQKNASSSVVFAGEKTRRETLSLLARSNFLLFPSVWYEGLALSMLEASALGVPIVASDLGGRRETIIDGETGILFESKNTISFVNAIKKLISSPELCEEMGRKARKRYEKLYSPSVNYEILNNIYVNLLKSE